MSNSIANSSTMNLLPVQAYFNADGTFNTFVGQGQPFAVTFSGNSITGATINNSSIGATTPSTGAFTSLSSTADATIHGLTVGLGSGSVASNTVVGYQTLNANTTGNNNTAVGFQAGLSNTTGTQNVFVGQVAGTAVTTGNFNTALGAASLYTATTGANNTAVGYLTLFSNTTASTNTALGCLAGYYTTTGSNNLILGYNAQASSATVSNEITIGNSANTVIRYPHSYSTVANLPSASTVGKGSRTFVTDALTPVFQTTVTGGGGVFTPVYSNGTNWVVG